MINWRNVQALESLLEGIAGNKDAANPSFLAGWLAARGVLATDALTDDQCVCLPANYPSPTAAEEIGTDVRAYLRDCSTDEGVPRSVEFRKDDDGLTSADIRL